MEIRHPRRILFVSPPGCATLDIVRDLTGSAPQSYKNGSTAGLTHEWNVQTAYYTAKIPIWIDEISELKAWESDFTKPEAKEVVEAVGAWIYCFEAPCGSSTLEQVEQTMRAIQNISEQHVGFGADTVFLAAAMPTKSSSLQQELEDIAISHNFEHIQYGAEGKNEFGEKVGFERLKEALESNDWAAASSSDVDALEAIGIDGRDDGDDFEPFPQDEAEMTAELYGIKSALLGDDWEPDAGFFANRKDEAAQVEDLDKMMGKLMAVREQSADLPEVQRKKLAAKAVRELMTDGG